MMEVFAGLIPAMEERKTDFVNYLKRMEKRKILKTQKTHTYIFKGAINPQVIADHVQIERNRTIFSCYNFQQFVRKCFFIKNLPIITQIVSHDLLSVWYKQGRHFKKGSNSIEFYSVTQHVKSQRSLRG